MRKFLAIVFAAGLSCISVHAQWYIFPGAGRSVREEPGTTEEEHFQDAINLSILLPLDAAGEEPNANFLEMYCGALMAVRDLGNSGLRLNVSVFDTRDGQNRISPEQLSDSHIIFGPIFPDEILEVSSLCPDSLCVISPLDPKAAAFERQRSEAEERKRRAAALARALDAKGGDR